VTFVNNASLTGSGLVVDSNGFNSSLAGSLSGAGGLTKLGLGAIVLTNTNIYTGATTVESGTLLVNGSVSSAVSVNGGTLGGTGTTGTILVNSGGTLSPGNSTGILHVSGNLNLSLGSTYLVELNGPEAGNQYDQTDVNGTVNLDNATLSALLSYIPTNTSSFMVISNDLDDAINGIFSGLPEGSVFNAGNEFLTISYRGGDGNGVVLTAQGTSAPDTSTTLVLLSLGLAGLLGFRGLSCKLVRLQR
jgi:autotransporter-associated beta strand protein